MLKRATLACLHHAADRLQRTCLGARAAVAADVIYFGGDIVTVNDTQPSVEALAVKDGRILAVGAKRGAD